MAATVIPYALRQGLDNSSQVIRNLGSSANLSAATAGSGAVRYSSVGTLQLSDGTSWFTIGNRVTALTDAATVNTNVDTTDLGTLATLSQATTFAAPTGTPVNGQWLVYRIISSTARALTWNAVFTGASGNSLPASTTGGGNTDYYGFKYNSTSSTWELITSSQGTPVSITAVTGMAAGASTFLTTPSSANLATLVTDETGSGALVFANSPTLVTPTLGTPASGTLTNCTGLPISTGVSGLGSGIATFLATPSSANLASAVTDETGSGALVFANSPTLVTPSLGAATATSIGLVNGAVGSATLTTASTTANQVIVSLPIATYRVVKFIIGITSSTNYHTTEISVLQDGTNTYLTQYADIYNSSSLASFDTDISGGNLRLLTTPVNAVTTYKVVYIGILV